MRATIVIAVEEVEHAAAVEAWFGRWGSRLGFRSENQGCGCCVHTWDVDAPPEAITELPEVVCAESEWTRGAA